MFRGPGSVVGIATGYGLDGPGIESWWGSRFAALVETGPGAHSASCKMVTWSSPGIKSGWGVTLTPRPFSCQGHKKVELYLYFPYGPYGLYRASVPVQGSTLYYVFQPSKAFIRYIKNAVLRGRVKCNSNFNDRIKS